MRLWTQAPLFLRLALGASAGLPGYEGWSLGVIEIDPALFDDSIERVNITLPKRVLRRLDDLATARHMSRGAFISELTMRAQSPD